MQTFMQNIAGSAAKIAFLLLIATSCAGFLMKLLPVEQFMLLATGASAFFFAYKGNGDQPYAGK